MFCMNSPADRKRNVRDATEGRNTRKRGSSKGSKTHLCTERQMGLFVQHQSSRLTAKGLFIVFPVDLKALL